MNRLEKQHLAGALASAAAEFLARRVETYDLTEAQAAEESITVAAWLKNLPGDEWDARLPDPTGPNVHHWTTRVRREARERERE